MHSVMSYSLLDQCKLYHFHFRRIRTHLAFKKISIWPNTYTTSTYAYFILYKCRRNEMFLNEKIMKLLIMLIFFFK